MSEKSVFALDKLEQQPLVPQHASEQPTRDLREPSPAQVSRQRLYVLVAFALLMLPSLFRAAPGALRHCRGGLRGFATKPGDIPTALPTHYQLPSGDRIPAVALGVWLAKPNEVGDAVKAALKAGYRHIDGAWAYRNEAEVGAGLAASGVPRRDVWLTSKLWNAFHAPDAVERALDETLGNLGVDYLDMYLMHWPIAYRGTETDSNGKPVIDDALTANPLPTWRKMEEMVAKGKVRNIGVSNFNIARLKNLTGNDLKIRPAVNQVELSFFNPQPELVAFAKENGLLLEAYSPLGSGKLVGEMLGAPAVKKAAAAAGLTPAQAVLSWTVQRGAVVLPKSVTPARIAENLNVSALPLEVFMELEAAAAAHEPRRAVNPSKAWGLKFDVFDDYPQ